MITKRNFVGLNRGVAAVVGSISCLVCLSVAHAHTLVGLSRGASRLSVNALAQIRGRYVSGSEVTYFGLAMTSQWTDAAGSATVGTQLVLNLQGRHRLSLSTYGSRQGTVDGSVQGGSGYRSVGPLASVSGVAQSVQLMGRRNVVNNSAAIDIVPTSQTASLVSTPTRVGRLRSGDGRVVIGANSVSVGMQLPGRGSVAQTLSTQGLMQNAQVVSSANTVLNQMILTVGLKSVSGVSNLAVGQVLASLRGVE
jgi:hypothetical protein